MWATIKKQTMIGLDLSRTRKEQGEKYLCSTNEYDQTIMIVDGSRSGSFNQIPNYNLQKTTLKKSQAARSES